MPFSNANLISEMGAAADGAVFSEKCLRHIAEALGLNEFGDLVVTSRGVHLIQRMGWCWFWLRNESLKQKSSSCRLKKRCCSCSCMEMGHRLREWHMSVQSGLRKLDCHWAIQAELEAARIWQVGWHLHGTGSIRQCPRPHSLTITKALFAITKIYRMEKHSGERDASNRSLALRNSEWCWR